MNDQEKTELALTQLRTLRGDVRKVNAQINRVASTLRQETTDQPPVTRKTPPLAPRADHVTVTIGGRSLEFKPLQVGDRVLRIMGDLAVVVVAEEGYHSGAIANAFPGVGTVTMQPGSIQFGGSPRRKLNSLTLHPGCAVTFANAAMSDFDPVGSSTGATIILANKARLNAGQFRTVAGRLVFGNKDANEGGGSLIYPGVRHWADSGRDGRFGAWQIMRGYAHRCPIFRWGREQFQQGRIVSAGLQDLTQPVDRTSSIAPVGYGSPDSAHLQVLPKLDGYNALDGQHLGRLGHVTAELTRQGSGLAKLILQALADHVADCWLRTTWQGLRQRMGAKPRNFQYWGCGDIRAHWPVATPCPMLGREFGHAIAITANAVRYCGRGQDSDRLGVMLETMNHCMSKHFGTPYALQKFDPIFGGKSHAWIHKIQEFGENVPAAEAPMIVKSFEMGILFFGLIAAESAPVGQAALNLARKLRIRLRTTINENSSQLWVPGHEEWNANHTVPWIDTLLSRTVTERARLDAAHLSPIDSGNCAGAFLGEWS